MSTVGDHLRLAVLLDDRLVEGWISLRVKFTGLPRRLVGS
jgi:hypothetical protein